MKQILGIITVIMALVGYAPYLRDTFKGKTKPHVVSWFLWTLVSFLVFGLQWSKGAGAGSYANFTMGLICLVIFTKSFKNGTKSIKFADVISFVLAIVAIILWLMVNQPLWSIILVVVIDILSFIPTFIKSFENPWQETLFTWLLNVIRPGLIMLSLQSVNTVTILFPLYAFVANFLFCTLLIARRKVIKADK